MTERLTPQQHQAVHNRNGKLLVSAAAGSGKTKVLVDRLLTYLTDSANPANLDDFLIITYTKAAASELRGKIAAKLSQRIAAEPENRHLQKQLQRLFLTKISTVHGFCSDILREYAFKLDLSPDFRVADESECREIRNQVLTDLLDYAYEQLGSDQDFLAFVDSQGLGRDDHLVPEIVEKVYDSARCHLNPDLWLDKCVSFAQNADVPDISETPWGNYLISDLHEYLLIQIHIFQECSRLLSETEGMEKAAVNIASTLSQLETLYQAQTWDEIVTFGSIDYGRLTFPRKNPDPELTDRVKAARIACKKGLEKRMRSFSDDSSRILLDLQQSSASIRGLMMLVKRFEQDYRAVKRSRRVLDFSDLEHKALDLLIGKNRDHATVNALEISRRFREILVDEYQDSNEVQDAILDALTGERQNCFLVGDVKQSIYQFRLADPSIFLEKYHSYTDAEKALPNEGRKVLLSHNFRSGPEVIECVNDVFSTCMRPKVGGLFYGEEEALREGIPHETLSDGSVEFYALDVQEDTYREEAVFVARRIQEMLRNGTVIRDKEGFRPVTAGDIVILLRSPGSAGHYFQRALEERGIRCTTGAGMDLLQAEEICTLHSLLQTIMNPRQDIPLLSVLASPIFAFTADDLTVIRSGHRKGSIFDALCSSDSDKVQNFLEVLDLLRKEARMKTITELLELCFRLTRLDSIYAASKDGQLKVSNLQAFYQLAAEYEKGSMRDLSQFLDYLDSIADRGLVTVGNTTSSAVNIMSIHKSKGLEFPVVFLANLSRRFNQESLRAQILCDKDLGLGLSVADTNQRIRYPSAAKRAISVKMAAESISEEMRVLYVAMTRAKDRLVMTYASQTLESDLADIVLRQDFDRGTLLCQEATCMGDWVLLTALKRTEAGELHAVSGKPRETHIGAYPWKICLSQVTDTECDVADMAIESDSMPAASVDSIRDALTFRYPNKAATCAPSKQTATDRKGRLKDEEVAMQANPKKMSPRGWRKPSFISQQPTGKEFGNAVHTAMQYISYEKCSSEDSIQAELQRMEDQGFLTTEQRQMVSPSKLYRFFATDIGRKLQQGTTHLREFKFSILDDGAHYNPDLSGEQVLLQGVVDCALLEDDGITVIDFKTDYVTEETLLDLTTRYRTQVQTYADALEKIFEKQIADKYIYFFRLDRFVKL